MFVDGGLCAHTVAGVNLFRSASGFLAGLAAGMGMLAAAPGPAALAADAAPVDAGRGAAELTWSWPEEDAVLWVPAKEARLVFSEPVRASATTATVSGEGDPRELTRTTRGESVDTVLFRFPDLAPGSYTMRWSSLSSSGQQLQGLVPFSVPERFSAPGGGNHRHQSVHAHTDSAGRLALRGLLVAAVAAVFFCARRPRSWRSEIGARVASLAAAVGAASWAMVEALDAALDNPAQPVQAALAAPALWFLGPFAAFALYRSASGFAGSSALGFSAAAVAAAALAVPGPRPWVTVPLAAGGLWITMLLFSCLLAAAVDRTRRPLIVASALLAALCALLLLYAYAGSWTLRGLFRSDVDDRGWPAALLLPAAGLAAALLPSKRLFRAAGFVAAGAAVAGALLLLRVPPAAVGL